VMQRIAAVLGEGCTIAQVVLTIYWVDQYRGDVEWRDANDGGNVQFWNTHFVCNCLGLFFLANAITGLVFLSRLATIVQTLFDQPKAFGAMVVAVNGAFNLGGRLAFGLASDRVGRKTCYVVTLSAQAIILAVIGPVMHGGSVWAFLGLIWTLSGCYGATFSLIPPLLADMFGARNIGACHGIVITAWSGAGIVGGLVFTAIYNSLVPAAYTPSDPWPYEVNFLWLLAVVLVGLVAVVHLRATPRDRMYPSAAGEVYRVRLFGRWIRVVKEPRWAVDVVGPRRQREEWRAWAAEHGLPPPS